MKTVLKGSIYISVKELMILKGKDLSSKSHYESTRRQHRAIRDSIQINKQELTVKEYCEAQGVPYEEVVEALNPYRF